MSPLPNYTTDVPVDRTVAEIMAELRRHGARSIRTDYDDEGNLVALSFVATTPWGNQAFRLPADVDRVLAVMERDHASGGGRSHTRRPDRAQAARVAWRIVRQWVTAQMAIIETEMVSMDRVMLPYALLPGQGSKTVYDLMAEERFLLPAPAERG